MITPTKALVERARRGGYAVGSFNVVNMESALGVLDAAHELSAPCVIALASRHAESLHLAAFSAFVHRAAADAGVPVALHFDHAPSVKLVEDAVEAGFTSVMFDGAGRPYAVKVAETRAMAIAAHANGVTAEAELEHIGRTGVEQSGGMTEPASARDFIDASQLDILAVSVGNLHGLTHGQTHLDLARLKRIIDATNCFVSLHGGSGIRKADLRSAIALGVAKVSYFTGTASATDMQLRAAASEADSRNLANGVKIMRTSFKEKTLEMIEALGASGKAMGPDY